MNFAQLILDASLIVQLVMLTLIAASILSWTIIFNKKLILKRARIDADQFEQRFWSVEDLNLLFYRITRKNYEPGGMERIFGAGFEEFMRLKKRKDVDADIILDSAQRTMRVAVNKEVETLEMHLALLATVGSTSPYIGLFGTVWGIMNSLQALGDVQQATLSMVAPGISEALIATAMGLFAAIPAVIAYNHYVNGVERLVNRYTIFIEEFSSVLNHYALP